MKTWSIFVAALVGVLASAASPENTSSIPASVTTMITNSMGTSTAVSSTFTDTDACPPDTPTSPAQPPSTTSSKSTAASQQTAVPTGAAAVNHAAGALAAAGLVAALFI